VNNGLIDKSNADDTDAADEKEEGYGVLGFHMRTLT
jgi:hypothetical protein